MRPILLLIWCVATVNCCAQIDTCQLTAISYTPEGYYVTTASKERCTCVVFSTDSIHGPVMVGVLLNGQRFGPWITSRSDSTTTYEERLGDMYLYATFRGNTPLEAAFMIPVEDSAYGHSLSSRPHSLVHCELENSCIQVVNLVDQCAPSRYKLARSGKRFKLSKPR
jgi:hypothetical protein